MPFFGIYISPSKAGFTGTKAQCAGSIAAENIKTRPTSIAKYGEPNEALSEDSDYPDDSPLWLIFTKKSKALNVLRHYREGRLREFPTREQAESYVRSGFENKRHKLYGNPKITASKPGTATGSTTGSYKTSYSDSDNPFSSPTSTNCSSDACSSSSMLNGSASGSIAIVDNGINSSNSSSSSISAINAERQPFRAPTKQELVAFRKHIEAGNYEQVKRTAWDNPRYLISSGDTPTSLKEGYRYNAMHICSQVNQARIAQLILKTISDPDFTQLYTGKKSSGEMCSALNDILLDYYLNMPDKGRGETPLHFAVKYGHVAVVEVLQSYPQCKSLENKEGKYPIDMILQRAQNSTPEAYKKLKLLLSEPHYVPVMRASHNEMPPYIGLPFTPRDQPQMQYQADESKHLNVKLTISALAGPMSREQAFDFNRRWKTPPRLGSNVISPLASSPYISPIKTPNNSCSSDQLPLGRRVLFSTMLSPSKSVVSKVNDHQIKQQQPPHNADEMDQHEHQHEEQQQHCIVNNNNNDCSLKVGSPSGFHMRQLRDELIDLERESRSNDTSLLDDLDLGTTFTVPELNDSFRERHIKNSDIEKGLEVVGRQLARQELVEWREYWDFLHTYIDIASAPGLSLMESYLAAQVEPSPDTMVSDKVNQFWNAAQRPNRMDLVADGIKSVVGTNSTAAAADVGVGVITQVMTPYTCVEKSLQVFAKRITKTLINNISNMVSINDTLLSELKRLKSLIVSFKDDARFTNVDFSKVHSRIAHLVASYIAHSMEDNSYNQLMPMLQKLLQVNGERREHLRCVCGSMLQTLKESSPSLQMPEVFNNEELCATAWQLELYCTCMWEANLSSKTSRRKRTESLRAQAQETATTTAATTKTAATLAGAAASLSDNSEKSTSNFTVYRNQDNHSDDDDSDNDDNDTIFFECIMDDSVFEDGFYTPPESRSPLLTPPLLEPRYELFIFGKEPTKRDLDVLKAIFNVKIEKETLPLVYAWRTAMESYSVAEMALFPSPKSVQRTHKPAKFGSSSINNNNIAIDGTSSAVQPKQSLLWTPKLKVAPSSLLEQKTETPPPPPPPQSPAAQPQPNEMHLSSSPMPMSTLASVAAATVTQSFQTPINKMRGLFSKYRESRQINSPVFDSPAYNKLSCPNSSFLTDESD